MSWKLIQNAERRLARETALVRPCAGGDVRVALGYPNTYFVGMSNLGLQVVYGFLNRIPGVSCERFFLPDPDELAEYEQCGRRLFTLESQRPVGEFDLVGFTMAYEPDYLNFLRMLELAGLQLKSCDRGQDHPLVLVGGALTLLNPEPIADFVDVFCVGEAEGRVEDLVECMRQTRGEPRRQQLEAIAAIPGFYVPSLYRPIYEDGRFAGFDPPAAIAKTYLSAEEFACQETHSLVLTEDTEFARSLLLEVSRGCPYVCRFCTVGFSYPKVRWKPLDRIWEAVERARAGGLDFQRVGLVSATVGNHPDIASLCERLRRNRIPVSFSSLRADQLPDELLTAMVEGGTRSLTLAPETGSEDLRKAINKRFTDEQYYDAARRAFRAGIKKIKMYSMVGLPHERDEDIDALVELVKKTRALQKDAVVTLGLGLFVPKPLTPFQWTSMADTKLAEDRMKRVQKALARVGGVRVNSESPRVALIEGLLARGDRRLGAVLLEVYRQPGYRSWMKALDKCALSLDELVYRQRDSSEPQPWDHLGASWSPERLVRDLARSVRP